jgi:hypothetical protein
VTQRTLLYIMSPSYSGSTLLTRLLSAHEEISTIGELKVSTVPDPDTYRCSCGERFLDCEFWQQVATETKKLGNPIELKDWQTRFSTSGFSDRAIRPTLHNALLEWLRHTYISLVPGAHRELQRILDNNEAIINAVCALQQGPVFLDDSKDPVRAMYFQRSKRWNLKVLFLTRDGRGTVNSDMKHNRLTLNAATTAWISKIREMDRLKAMLGHDQLLEMRYEDLCNQTSDSLTKIAEFTGISTSSPWDSNDPGHILGNEMRLRGIDEIQLDEKWREDLNPTQLTEFQAMAGKLNAELGYAN